MLLDRPRRFAVPVALLLAALAARPPHAAEAPESPEPREREPQRLTVEELEARAAGAALRPRVPEKVPLEDRSERVMISGPAGLDWTFLGPRPITGEYWSGGQSVSGRVSCIVVHPTNPSIAYLAAAQGGVFRTTNAGANWTARGDLQLPTLASGWIEIDPATPTTIYYGTGEAHYSGDSFYGDGLFKSTNEGANWTKLADDAVVGAYIARVRLDPGSSQVLYVGGSGGFVRSTNGGTAWSQTLGGGWCDDLVTHASSPGEVFATINGHGIYRSTNQGQSWTQLAGGLPASGFGRINLAWAPSDANRLYAVFVAPNGSLFGVYKTTDRGVTWAKQTSAPDFLGTQGWYDCTVAVHPTNANICFAGGFFPYSPSVNGLVRTLDGGATWTDVTDDLIGTTLHPDMHVVAFGSDARVWVGNDGGVWNSTDLGDHWTNRNSTLPTAMLYTLALHPTAPNSMLSGTQDNGTLRFFGSQSWLSFSPGDGGPVLFEKTTPNIFYSTYISMTFLTKWDNGVVAGDVTGPWQAAGDRADWSNGPLVEDPNHPGVLLAGTYRVYRSPNSGTNWDPPSPDLAAGGVLRALAYAPSNSNIVYSGSNTGVLFRSPDGAATWSPRTSPAGGITDLCVDPADQDVLYVSLDFPSTSVRVKRSADGGATWQSLGTNAVGGIPAGLRGLSLAVDFRPTYDRLYLGTDHGVYASVDGGATWVAADGGSAVDIAVYDLGLDTVNNVLVAATHGRGAYRALLDMTAPAAQLDGPNGGEVFGVGATQTLRWTASDAANVSSVDLFYTTTGAAPYDTVVIGVPNSGAYDWTVPNMPTTNARVKVVAHDPSNNLGEDVSDDVFTITDVTDVPGEPPASFALHPARPSVGRPPIELSFALPRDAHARLELFDVGGRRLRELVDASLPAGEHRVRWDGRGEGGEDLREGVYFVRLVAGEFMATRRIALLR